MRADDQWALSDRQAGEVAIAAQPASTVKPGSAYDLVVSTNLMRRDLSPLDRLDVTASSSTS